jgi:hypothetical protein
MKDACAIPVIDARDGGPLAAAAIAQDRLRELLSATHRVVPSPLLTLADRRSRQWLDRSRNPYLQEIDAVASLAGKSGAYALNASYEWCCTSGVGDDLAGGVRLLRTLDWRLPGLGRSLIVVWQRGPAGDFANITWPGFVGVATALAPGRFAVALNLPPALYRGLTLPIDWLINRIEVWRSDELPPGHLLRQVCETCATYDDARRRLTETPLSLPALFTLAGTAPGEGCVIERTPHAASRRDLPAAVANHWVGLPLRGRPRGVASRQRQALMEAALVAERPWAVPPIINRDTRLVAAMNPALGSLQLQGWERNGPVTAELTLQSS